MPLVLLPAVTGAIFAAGALRAFAAPPLGPYGEAYPHIHGHLVLAAVALLVGCSMWQLRGREVPPAGRRASLVCAGGWVLVACAGAIEAAGAAIGDGSGENAVHTLGILLIGPGLALAALGHLAVMLMPGSRLLRLLGLALGITVAGWYGLGTAGSGALLLLGLATAAVWWLAAATAYRQQIAGSSPSGVPAPLSTAVAGGLLWIPYGALELLRPWGPDTRYDAASGYDVVVDVARFTAYSLPASLALLLSGLALITVNRRLATGGRVGGVAGHLAVALGVLSAAGVLLQFDPVFTSASLVGTLLLGVGVLATARHAAGHSRPVLVLLGTVGVALPPLWPLVYAVQWLPAAAAAGVFVLHGAAWIALGATPTDRTAATDGPAVPHCPAAEPGMPQAAGRPG